MRNQQQDRGMEASKYVVVQDWMIAKEGLKGNDLLIFALIHGFTQDGQTLYRGSYSYIMKFFGISRPTARKSLKNLEEKGLIKKTTQEINGVVFNFYHSTYGGGKENYPPGKNVSGGGKESFSEGGKNLAPVIYYSNNNSNNSSEKILFPGRGASKSYLIPTNRPKEKEKSSAKKEKEKNHKFSVRYHTEIFSEHFPEHLRPSNEKQWQNWFDTVDKLKRIDGIPYEVIDQVVQWARNDEFWSSNFLSLTKLRKKNKDGVPYIVVFAEKIKSTKSNKVAQAALKNSQGW